jgi:hypothetical protein
MRKRILYCLIVLWVVVLGAGLPAPIVAQYEDADGIIWNDFGFDTSSRSWKQDGEKGFNLRNGDYVTLEEMRSGNGDYVKVSGFSPYWITLEISGRYIVFSSDENYDDRAEEKARNDRNSLSVRYEDTYVAAFGPRTYTIQIFEGEYGLVRSSAQFMYHPGGIPSPGDTAKKAASKKAPSPAARKPRKQIPGRINTLTIVLKMPSSEESAIFVDADLTLEFTGPAHFLTTYLSVPADGMKRTFSFHDIPAGTYNMEITWGDKSIAQSVDVYKNMSRLDLFFY